MLKYDNYIIQPMQKFILGKKKKKAKPKTCIAYDQKIFKRNVQ